MPTDKNLGLVEIKAFVPAKDFATSLSFYQDLGFEIKYNSGAIAYLAYGDSSFLLQNCDVEEHTNHFMMHLLIKDADAWYAHIVDNKIPEKYGSRLTTIVQQAYRMRDFTLTDPSGVLWVIGQNTD